MNANSVSGTLRLRDVRVGRIVEVDGENVRVEWGGVQVWMTAGDTLSMNLDVDMLEGEVRLVETSPLYR